MLCQLDERKDGPRGPGKYISRYVLVKKLEAVALPQDGTFVGKCLETAESMVRSYPTGTNSAKWQSVH